MPPPGKSRYKPKVHPVRGLIFHSALALALAACGGQHFRVPAEGPPSGAPRYVELEQEKQIATLHFPAGAYTFYAVDDKGYYYRAPRAIIEHTGSTTMKKNGGIYLSKRDPNKLRGYIYIAGGITQVGDLSRVKHHLGDEPAATESIGPPPR